MGFVYIYENVKHSRSQEDKISKTINGPSGSKSICLHVTNITENIQQ